MWWGKVPKSVAEKLKPPADDEIQRRMDKLRIKCESELDKFDWNLLKKHLHTPEAREEYEKFCREGRDHITKHVTRLGGLDGYRGLGSEWYPDRYLQYFYGKFPYLSFKELVLLKLTDGKGLLQKRYPSIVKYGLGFAVFSCAWMMLGNQKKKED